jgi:Tol biopolymer transport system component
MVHKRLSFGGTLRLAMTLVAAIAITSTGGRALAHSSRRLTHQPGFVDYWPRFSPDGKTVLFSRCEISSGCGGASTGGYWTLWTVSAAGGTARPFLALERVSATRSNWLWNSSITSEQIAFTGVDTGNGHKLGLWLVNGDGSNPVEVPLPASVGGPSYPSWFPDGDSVAVTGLAAGEPGPHLTQVAISSGDPIRMLTLPTVIWTGEPAVSRSGKMLADAAQLPIEGQQYNDANNQIWIEAVGEASTQDLGLHQLDALQARTPDWSPNDRFLIFESSRGCVNGNYAIFMEAVTGGKAVQATDCSLNANHAVWSPDGKRFAFSYAFGNPTKGKCAGGGCRGIAVAPVPSKIRRLGTAS